MKSYGQYCALAYALDAVGERWTLLIVRELLTGPRRFSELRAGLPGVPTNILASRLKQMLERDLIAREPSAPGASAMRYQLTPTGLALRESVHSLVRWGARFMHERPRADELRSHWLVVALDALRSGSRVASCPATLRIELPEGAIVMRIDEARIRLARFEDPEPKVVLSGSAQAVLEFVAGGVAAARAGVSLIGPEANEEKVRGWLAGSRPSRRR